MNYRLLKSDVGFAMGGSMRLEEEYEGCHSEMDCPGAWEIVWKEDIPRYLDPQLFVMLPKAPFVTCTECESAFYPEGFEDGVDEWVMVSLVTDNRLLTKPQLKFLRTQLGLRQKDVSRFLGFSYKGMESYDSDVALDPYSMMRLKIWYASEIGVPSGNWINMVTKPDFDNDIKLPIEVPLHVVERVWRDCARYS